jgi:predicted nucleic-acid-binding protein
VSGSGSVLPDTNVVLRYLLKDVPEQYTQAEKFFEQVRTGKVKAVILKSVLVKCVYILLKFYQVPKRMAAESLIGLLQYKGLANRDKAELVDALQMFAQQTVDIVDCLLLAKARHGNGRLLSFDKDLSRLAKDVVRGDRR